MSDGYDEYQAYLEEHNGIPPKVGLLDKEFDRIHEKYFPDSTLKEKQMTIDSLLGDLKNIKDYCCDAKMSLKKMNYGTVMDKLNYIIGYIMATEKIFED